LLLELQPTRARVKASTVIAAALIAVFFMRCLLSPPSRRS
jgi:hypothetical protein